MASRGETRLLRRLDRHGRTLAVGAEKQQPPAGAHPAQLPVSAEMLRKVGVRQIDGAFDFAAPLALALFAQVHERHVRPAEQRHGLGGRWTKPRGEQ